MRATHDGMGNERIENRRQFGADQVRQIGDCSRGGRPGAGAAGKGHGGSARVAAARIGDRHSDDLPSIRTRPENSRAGRTGAAAARESDRRRRGVAGTAVGDGDRADAGFTLMGMPGDSD